jgi:rSAM/selenodomain-associated transferase 1
MAEQGNKSILIIFVKNIIPGKVKTRIAKTLGDEKTLEIYQDMLVKIKDVVRFLPFEKAIFYSDEIVKDDIWDSSFQKHLQEGNDIGERMHNAIEKMYNQGYGKITLIGSDCYQLTSSIIMDSFRFLTDHDVVIGPAQDGGYYLIAMTGLYNGLFEDKDWGTSKVLSQTKEDLRKYEIKHTFVAELNDIDDEEDLRQSAPDLLEKYQSV